MGKCKEKKTNSTFSTIMTHLLTKLCPTYQSNSSSPTLTWSNDPSHAPLTAALRAPNILISYLISHTIMFSSLLSSSLLPSTVRAMGLKLQCGLDTDSTRSFTTTFLAQAQTPSLADDYSPLLLYYLTPHDHIEGIGPLLRASLVLAASGSSIIIRGPLGNFEGSRAHIDFGAPTRRNLAWGLEQWSLGWGLGCHVFVGHFDYWIEISTREVWWEEVVLEEVERWWMGLCMVTMYLYWFECTSYGFSQWKLEKMRVLPEKISR